MPDQPVYHILAEHQQQETAGWDMERLIKELHRWKEIYVVEFKIEIPSVAFCIKPTRSNCYGYFRPGHNEFGLTREIAINKNHLACRERWQVLGTLLHELLHAWQDAFGTPGKRNYHNAQFRETALRYGLVVDRRGVTDYATESPLMEHFRKYGVEIPELPKPSPRPPGTSTLKKWSCGCTNVRVGIADFKAKCLKCNRGFVPIS
jgi:SprT-like family